MKVTDQQISKALKNTFEIGKDGPLSMYNAIRANYDKADRKANIKKSYHYYTKTDKKKIYAEIKKLLK